MREPATVGVSEWFMDESEGRVSTSPEFEEEDVHGITMNVLSALDSPRASRVRNCFAPRNGRSRAVAHARRIRSLAFLRAQVEEQGRGPSRSPQLTVKFLKEHDSALVPEPHHCQPCHSCCSSGCACACHPTLYPSKKQLLGTWLANFVEHCRRIPVGLPLAVRCVSRATAAARPDTCLALAGWSDILASTWGWNIIMRPELTEATLDSQDAGCGRRVFGARVRRSIALLRYVQPRRQFEDDGLVSTPGSSSSATSWSSTMSWPRGGEWALELL